VRVKPLPRYSWPSARFGGGLEEARGEAGR